MTATTELQKAINFKEHLIELVDVMLTSEIEYVSTEFLVVKRDHLVAEKQLLAAQLALVERREQRFLL